MSRLSSWRGVGLVAILVLSAAACGGDDDDDTAADDSTETPDGAVTAIGKVKSAVIQIVAKGTFAEPAGSLAAYEEYEGGGSGSGFIIDPSGIAVTNNHVVTGATTLEVYVGGSEVPVNAKVLGVSECSDLAVIDLEGDGYPFLAWHDGDIEPGLEVRAAGFPLGDPEFTLTSGIVSKAKANGDTNWASVDSVIEHDANIQPGNSGGPLVNADTAKVVAVNYSGGDPGTGTSQFFAINSKLARKLVEQLEKGDVLSLGVNGQAVYDEESGVSGIWVSSVHTDSPAGELGLRGGDIIEKIEGISVGADGTMKDYCDILQSHDEGDKLAVQVLRYEEDARFSGEFNGDELVPFASLSGDVREQTGELEEGEEYAEYVEVADDSDAVAVEVPVEWADVSGEAVTLDDGTELPNVSAAPDLDAFFSDWTSPGVSVSAVSSDVGDDVDDLLDEVTSGAADACTDEGREDYEDNLYTGRIHYFSNCGGTGGVVVAIAAQPAEGGFTVLVVVQLTSEADYEALDRIIETFVVEL